MEVSVALIEDRASAIEQDGLSFRLGPGGRWIECLGLTVEEAWALEAAGLGELAEAWPLAVLRCDDIDGIRAAVCRSRGIAEVWPAFTFH